MALDRRVLRLQQLILETVATTIQRDLDDPRIQMVTVSRIKLARDLTMATVYWSCLAEGGARRTVEGGLQDALPVIQRAVAKAMMSRQTPRLTLRFDEGLAKAARVNELFAKLEAERRARGEPPSEPPPEPLPDAADEDGSAGEDAAGE